MQTAVVIVIVSALIFLTVYVAVDRYAAVLQSRSRDKADVEKKRADVEMSKDLSAKLVETMQAMSGQGIVNNAMRMANGAVINQEDFTERVANGRSLPRDGGQHSRVPEGFQQPRATTEAGR